MLNELCKDEDGCTVSMSIRDSDSINQPGQHSTTPPRKMFLSQSSNWYTLSGLFDMPSLDGDGFTRFLIDSSDCRFTDADSIDGNALTDTAVGLGFVNKIGGSSDPNLVCILDFDD